MRQYLGRDDLVKHVLLQLLDVGTHVVNYCHSLGIYHRYLKPVNVLGVNGGPGLGTTEKSSGPAHEFWTSVRHRRFFVSHQYVLTHAQGPQRPLPMNQNKCPRLDTVTIHLCRRNPHRADILHC